LGEGKKGAWNKIRRKFFSEVEISAQTRHSGQNIIYENAACSTSKTKK
jgi:hypothetical protein